TLDELVVEGALERPQLNGSGNGASAARDPRANGRTAEELDEQLERAAQNVIKALGKALMKTISKMGISTIQSYCGAQIFEAVGLEKELIDQHLTGTASRIGGGGLDVLSTEAMERHVRAYPRTPRDLLPVGGVLQWRRDGELHVWNPDTIAKLQHAVRGQNGNTEQTYEEFTRLTNEEAVRHGLLRG